MQEEIEHHFHYNGVKIIVYPNRFTKEGTYNYDIGLVKLDRSVVFATDVLPICLDGLVPGLNIPKKNYDKVFISGFGLTLYRKAGQLEKPECSTNQFLPRPFHTCKVHFLKSISKS